MDTRFLHSFILTAEHGSMAEAARRLAVTPAAIAQRIRALEDEIGHRLLTRVGRTVRTTPSGAAVLARGRLLLQGVDDLRRLATGDELSGAFRIGSISTALTGLLPRALSRLVKTAPKLEVFIEPGTSIGLYRRVEDDAVDAAILVKPPFKIPKTLEWALLRSEPLIVLAPPSAEGCDPHDLLAREPFIRYDRNHWGGQLAARYLASAGISPRERMELDALDAIALMVAEGLGVALVPEWAPPWPHDLSLAKLALPGHVPVRRVGLLWRRNTVRTRLLQELTQALRL